VLDHGEDDRRDFGGAGYVGGADRVAVHRRVVERRNVDVGDDVFG
jgi:hypothetical protein